MFLVRVLIASIITVATAYGCYPVADPQGGEDGFDHRETRTRTSVGPGFDSPHLHTVGGGGVVVPPHQHNHPPAVCHPYYNDDHHTLPVATIPRTLL